MARKRPKGKEPARQRRWFQLISLDKAQWSLPVLFKATFDLTLKEAWDIVSETGFYLAAFAKNGKVFYVPEKWQAEGFWFSGKDEDILDRCMTKAGELEYALYQSSGESGLETIYRSLKDKPKRPARAERDLLRRAAFLWGGRMMTRIELFGQRAGLAGKDWDQATIGDCLAMAGAVAGLVKTTQGEQAGGGSQPPPLLETPMRLKEFMKGHCAPLSENALESRALALRALDRRIKNLLPPHVGPWRKGQAKRYLASTLRAKWPEYINANLGLPALKNLSAEPPKAPQKAR